MDDTFEITLRNANLNITAIISCVLGNSVLESIARDNLVPITSKSIPGKKTGNKPSPANYIKESRATQHLHKMIAVGCYAHRTEKKETFLTKDLRRILLESGEMPFTNFSREFNKGIRREWIAPAPNNNEKFYITEKGKKAFNKKFA